MDVFCQILQIFVFTSQLLQFYAFTESDKDLLENIR